MVAAVVLDALGAASAKHSHLRLLVLHGSRARGDEHDGSDWDFGYLADEPFDAAALLDELGRVLRTDAVDLTDLARASALLRFGAARDGRCVHERAPGEHLRFVHEATRFWCDAEAVIRRAHADVLADLPG
ncbi:MAG: type VII toxin-antitoxin system MntA family adenylyltransferase antitoxin [Pseudonocardia sp.]